MLAHGARNGRFGPIANDAASMRGGAGLTRLERFEFVSRGPRSMRPSIVDSSERFRLRRAREKTLFKALTRQDRAFVPDRRERVRPRKGADKGRRRKRWARTRGEPHPMTTRSRLNSLPRHGDPPELSEKTGAMDLCAEKPRLEPAAPLQRRLWNRRRPVSEDFARAAVASRSDPSRANDARARCRAPA